MKALLAVDTQGLYHAASRLIRRLEFQDPSVELITVIEPPGIGVAFQPEGRTAETIMRDLQDAAREELAAAKSDFPSAPTRTLYGNAPTELLDYANKAGVNLVAAGSERKDAFSALFFGSITRALASAATQSILVGKQPVHDAGKLNVVIATDHSEYANRAFDRLLAFAPQGIAKATVLTATPLVSNLATDMVNGIPVLIPSDADWSHKRVREESEQLVGRLAAIGVEAHACVVEAHPNLAIEDTMNSEGAELLILGAQGHGFFSRLLIGSVSFHQVVSTPHSVLVIRA